MESELLPIAQLLLVSGPFLNDLDSLGILLRSRNEIVEQNVVFLVRPRVTDQLAAAL